MAAPVSNVVHGAPHGPPGPATFDTSKFKGNAGTLIVDTAHKTINSNYVNTGRLRAYGDPSDPTAPGVSTPALATQIIYAPYFDIANTAQFNPVALFGNSCTYLTQQLFVQGSVTVGKPFNWRTPHFSSIIPSQPVLNGKTFAQAYPLSGGQVRGYAKLYGLPQPALATQGTIINLNGGTVGGNSIIYT